MSRRQQIESMLENDPDDVFLNYALALEMDKAEEYDAALDRFDKLTQSEPPYVPAFFMAGQMLHRIDRTEEACRYLTRGIAAASEQGDGHAQREMQEFLDMIDDD